MKYGIYDGAGGWLFNIEADSPEEALTIAKADRPEAQSAKLISEQEPGQGR